MNKMISSGQQGVEMRQSQDLVLEERFTISYLFLYKWTTCIVNFLVFLFCFFFFSCYSFLLSSFPSSPSSLFPYSFLPSIVSFWLRPQFWQEIKTALLRKEANKLPPPQMLLETSWINEKHINLKKKKKEGACKSNENRFWSSLWLK